MKPNLTELVNVITQRLEESPEAPLTESRIRSWLASQGYHKRDIDAAIRIVRPQFAGTLSERPPKRPGAVRHYSPDEVFKLSAEAQQVLARLDLYELITPYERELILERVTQYEGEVGLDELDYLLTWMLYSTRDVESQQTLYNVFDNARDLLH